MPDLSIKRLPQFLLALAVAYAGARALVWAVDALSQPFASLGALTILLAVAALLLAPPAIYFAFRFVFGDPRAAALAEAERQNAAARSGAPRATSTTRAPRKKKR